MRLKTARDCGLVIREHRCALKMTQQALADSVGVGRQWLVAVEKGKAGAELGLVLRTLQVLGVHVAVAVSETEQAATQVQHGIPDLELRPSDEKTPGAVPQADDPDTTAKSTRVIDNLAMAQAAALRFIEAEVKGGQP